DAEALMRQHRIRHLPVLYRGTLVGILSDRDLQSALPSPTTTLSMGEIRFYLARLQVSQVMTRQVLTITPQMPLAEATRLMARQKAGGLAGHRRWAGGGDPDRYRSDGSPGCPPAAGREASI